MLKARFPIVDQDCHMLHFYRKYDNVYDKMEGAKRGKLLFFMQLQLPIKWRKYAIFVICLMPWDLKYVPPSAFKKKY